MSQLSDSAASQFSALLNARRSVRGFRAQPVEEETLRKIFAMASKAPSNCNVQPWRVHVVSGEAIERLRNILVTATKSRHEGVPDFALTPDYCGRYRERQIEAAISLFEATSVERHDRTARERSMLRNYEFFGAPHAAFVTIPDWAGYREASDCGMFVQSLALALTAHGLASCIQGTLSHYANLVREELGFTDEERLLVGLSFGYEDPHHPANAVRTERESVDDFVTFHADRTLQ